MYTILSRLRERTSNSQLVTFRILFGLVMAAECWGAILTRLVDDIFISTPFNFTFIGFEWLSVLHGPVMYRYYAAMGALGICVAIGLLYRVTSVLLALMWTAAYLAEKTHYNNHYYLMVLLCWLMAAMPANRRASVDVRIWPSIKTAFCSRWKVTLFTAQVAIVYFFAAVAKMNSDWLHAMPLKLWMGGKGNVPVIGSWLVRPAAPWVISYVGLMFDLLVVPMLLYPRTRVAAFVLSIVFHLGNSLIFQIGTFPYLALTLSVFFFPARMFERLLPKYGDANTGDAGNSPLKMLLAGTYLIWQLVLPLRHWAFPGDVAWTEEGHRMAWRMMLRSKTGYVNFKVRDTSGHEWIESPYTHLHPEQAADVSKQPDMCWQFAQYLRHVYAGKGIIGVQVFAMGEASVNGGPSAPLVDSQVNLAGERWKPFTHHHWITERPSAP